MRLLLTILLVIAGCSKTTPPPTITPPARTPPLVLPESVIELFAQFRQCDQMELVSLNPRPNAQGPKLCGWTVLGSTVIEDAALRLRLVDEIASASLPSGAIVMDCFEPRHALRISTHGSHYDVIICFACNAVSVYADGDTTQHTGFCITKAPNDSFNQVLSAAGVSSARR